jgi:undecaprenyl-diphosphatase
MATTHPTRRPAAALAPLLSVSAAALVFAALLVLVRTQWAPLESVDHGLAADLNSLVAGHPAVVWTLQRVTWLGSVGALWTVVIASAVVLLIRCRYRLAIWVTVTGAGALVLDPVLKSLVGRVRPVVAHPIATGNGASFPSGHSLGSLVCYGAVLLAFLPGIRPRWRTSARVVIGVVIVAVGVSRLMLGVHYLSDVIGAWGIGIAWLGLTAYAFEVVRSGTGRPVTQPLAEGLEPESAGELEPASAEPPARHRPGRTAAGVAIGWVLILGLVTGFGELVTRYGNGNVLGDETVPHWLAAHRDPSRDSWSEVFSNLGGTQWIVIVALATCVLAVAILRRWRPAIFVAVLMVGEVTMFLLVEAVVRRDRPDVAHLDHKLPTSSYPSGHVAATLCLYVGIAVIVIGQARGWWRWLFLVPAVAMPVLVALSRMYRGEHHPTDVTGSAIFAALWIPLLYLLIRPNGDAGGPRGPIRRRDGQRATAAAE